MSEIDVWLTGGCMKERRWREEGGMGEGGRKQEQVYEYNVHKTWPCQQIGM